MTYLSPSSSTQFFTDIEDILGEIEFIRKGKSEYIANVPAVIDIETSSFYKNGEKQCCMYAFVFGINGRCIRGRSWQDLLYYLDRVINYYNLNSKRRMIFYIHNLGYEFQFMRKYFEFDKVFSMDMRKPIYAITKQGIEFRCSYILSGYSLEKLGENLLKYKVTKKKGDLDYSLIRHSKTPLTDKEWGYILNDGLVVMAHIQEEIERLGNITNIPYTKTGYVRNLCREKCLKGKNKFDYSKMIRNLTLTEDDYLQCKRTYMGGFTHANINYVDKVIKDVYSFDFSSSYPAVMLSERFPMSKPYPVTIKDEADLMTHLMSYCCMFDVRFENIRATTEFENYISISRCIEVSHPVVNNGRIVEAESLFLSVTEQDFLIILQMYEWDDMEIYNFKKFYKGYLPKDLILSILELYRKKTMLKGVEGKEVEYMVSKNMINSMYGMCVTDVCRNEFIYNNGWVEKASDIQEQIKKYNTSNNRFLYYPWGIWVTAYARANLFTGILEFGDDYIYSDTDSVKVKNKSKHIDYINRYNEIVTEKVNMCLESHNIPIEYAVPKTLDGVPKPLGVWDYEGKYDRFKTLGAKRYMTEKNGSIDITIAGVGKKAGCAYLKHTFGDNTNVFKNFKEYLTFPAHYDKDGIDENGSGKLCHTYIDDYMEDEITDYLGNTYTYKEQSGVHMENTEYTLSLEFEFKNLLLGIKGGHTY